MPTKQLPANPSLAHLKHQAKDLIREHTSREPSSAQRLREFHPSLRLATDHEIFSTRLTLGDAQLAIAREYGFASWTRIKHHIERPDLSDNLALPHHERIDDAVFRQAVNLIDAGDVSGLSRLLQANPNLIHQRVLFEGGNYFRNPGLLEFIAENPVRHGTLPPNIIAVAVILLEAGPEQRFVNDTLGLVVSGRMTRECKVQIPLIDVLCKYGADPNSALHTAVLHGEFEAVYQLIRWGATPDLSMLAALGETEEFLSRLPLSDSGQRHLALALAAQYGHTEIVRALLDAGEDPNRYNPPGSHSHATPLHQAALAGHLGVVRLLVERGARLDTKDVIWQGTPADWAQHDGRTEVESYLRELFAASQTVREDDTQLRGTRQDS
ncbi:MAG TPA: ankyrin repeat domain-containing protein [Acidobacteriaceae bacterium]|nr:ankyrin repeat domain-containing protein [Acidobacteriaceae bacterium]